MEILSWLFFLVFIGALIVVGGLLLKGYMTTGSPTSGLTGALQGAFFGPKPEKRLEIMDQMNVDGRRRLVLIRRDDVEHLLMTGGPVDVVIETGIGQGQQRPPAAQTAAAEARPVPADRMAFAEPAPVREPQLSAQPTAPAGPVTPRHGVANEIVEPSVFSRPARSLSQAVGDP